MYNIDKMADLNFMGFHQLPPPPNVEDYPYSCGTSGVARGFPGRRLALPEGQNEEENM